MSRDEEDVNSNDTIGGMVETEECHAAPGGGYPEEESQGEEWETMSSEGGVSHSNLLKCVQQVIKSVHMKRDQDKDLLLRVKEAADLQVRYSLHKLYPFLFIIYNTII